MATASKQRGHGNDAELARAMYQVLAILTDLRIDAGGPALRDRIELVQWLRGELAAVETLLTDAYERQAAAAPKAADVASVTR